MYISQQESYVFVHALWNPVKMKLRLQLPPTGFSQLIPSDMLNLLLCLKTNVAARKDGLMGKNLLNVLSLH